MQGDLKENNTRTDFIEMRFFGFAVREALHPLPSNPLLLNVGLFAFCCGVFLGYLHVATTSFSFFFEGFSWFSLFWGPG